NALMTGPLSFRACTVGGGSGVGAARNLIPLSRYTVGRDGMRFFDSAVGLAQNDRGKRPQLAPNDRGNDLSLLPMTEGGGLASLCMTEGKGLLTGNDSGETCFF